MKTLYFDCFAGASGNMILGALIALGVDERDLNRQLELLDVADFQLVVTRRDKSGISATHVEVNVPDEKAHRHLHQIETLIGGSRLPETVKTRALAIFSRLAAAEAKVHGIDAQQVHFHEVGAMDAIVDIVGACIGFEILGIERFVCSKIHVGSGFVKMAHGTFPIPPPAVAELLKDATIYSTEIVGELMTPTGAAIISTVCSEYGQLPEIKIEQTAYGAGTREIENFPNALRLIVGQTAKLAKPAMHSEKLIRLEANLDDISAEILGFVMEKALSCGALDCWFTPIQMKKNRPATMISVLCRASVKDFFTDFLVRETTTLGVRISELARTCLDREIAIIQTKFGEVPVKISKLGGETVNIKPEYDRLKEIAEREKLSLREVESEVRKSIK